MRPKIGRKQKAATLGVAAFSQKTCCALLDWLFSAAALVLIHIVILAAAGTSASHSTACVSALAKLTSIRQVAECLFFFLISAFSHSKPRNVNCFKLYS